MEDSMSKVNIFLVDGKEVLDSKSVDSRLAPFICISPEE